MQSDSKLLSFLVCFCKQNAIKSIFFLTNRRTFAAVNEQSVTKK